jgi:anti-sigma factor ChrR (cupin superfamily)
MRRIVVTAAVALALGMLPMATSAQQAVTQAQVVAACTVANNAAACKDIIAQFVAKFPAGSVVLQQAIADLVVALATSPAATDPVLKAAVSVAIQEVATKSPDPEQVAQIKAIALTIDEGTVQTATVVVKRPASEN